MRRILDDAGFADVRIFASSSLDEFAIEALVSRGACIDAFGVGTRMGVSADRPYLDIVYKLVRLGQRDVRKHSAGKATVAGEKQVFRRLGDDGMMVEDIIGCRDEAVDGAVPLLMPVMEKGRPIARPDAIDTIRDRIAAGLSGLPAPFKALRRHRRFPVSLSARLQAKQS